MPSLLDNLIFHFKMNEDSGVRADSHGVNHLTDNNTVTFDTGLIGNAAVFNAANTEYLNRASSSALQPGDADFTINLWIYPVSNAGAQTPIGRWPASGNYEYLFNRPTDRTMQVFLISDGTVGTISSVTSTDLTPNNTWSMVTFRYDAAGNLMNLKINNGTAVTASHSGGCFAGNGNLTFGRNDDGPVSYFDGRIDSASFWKRRLADAEVTKLWNGGAGLDYNYFTQRGHALKSRIFG